MREESGFDDGARGEVGVDEDVEFECFSVDVADFHAALVGEEDRITFAGRGDADVEFGVGRVGEERLEDESGDGASDGFHLLPRQREE